MSDFNKLRDIFEMSEVLNSEFENTLEVITFDKDTDQRIVLTFICNQWGELEKIESQII